MAKNFAGGRADLKIDRVNAIVDKAETRGMRAVAIEVGGLTKLNIQQDGEIDTGFMMNSVYDVGKEDSGYDETMASGVYPGVKTGGGQRDRAPEVRLPRDAAAATVIGANYAIYREVKKSKLVRAAQQVVGRMGGRIEGEFKKEMKD